MSDVVTHISGRGKYAIHIRESTSDWYLVVKMSCSSASNVDLVMSTIVWPEWYCVSAGVAMAMLCDDTS
jgi:hypothetical protein